MQVDFSKIRCIAFDLDDTILNAGRELSERTADVLRRAAESGIALVPVSGRPFGSYPACIRELDGISCAVTSNGAAVYDMRSGERIHQWLMKPADVRAIMRSVGNYFLEGQITYEAFVDGVAYASADYVGNPARFGVPQSAVPYIQQTRRPNRFIIDFIFEHAKEMDSLDIVLKEPGMYRMIENTIRRSVDHIHITSAVPYRMEISDGDSGKAAGLAWVLDRLQIRPEETIALGDGENDAEMLAFAGCGVALKNAAEACRDRADYITERIADEDGAAEFLESHLLL
ncbi:MAG: HAD-IIB family hydrolase [Clostridiales bacterium]|nr:HAD-IIB family hydrolase [Clostridiales bacterium]